MKLDFKNRTIKYIALIVAVMLGVMNTIFNDYKNIEEISIIIVMIFIVNFAYDYYIKKNKIRDVSSGIALKVRILIFSYTYLIGAYALYLSGAFDNSSILMYFAIVVFIGLDFFGKRLGTIVYILTLLQGYVYYSVYMTDSSAWRIMMTIISLTSGYAVGIYLEMMKKNQLLLKQKISEMEMLFRISKLIDEFPGVDKIISSITKIIVDYLSVSECYIMLYDEKLDMLINKSTYTYEEKIYNDSIPKMLKAGEGFPGKVYLSGESVFFYNDSIDEITCSSCEEREIRSFAVVPIKFYEKVLGIITVTSREYIKRNIQSEKMLETVASRVGMVVNSQKMFRELENATRKDSLTGLFNHGYFYEKLSYEIRTIKEEEYSIYVMMMDLDKFKSINDKYGHIVGDQVLKEIGYILKLESENFSIAARYGGEEFGVIIKSDNPDSVTEFANKIRRDVLAISNRIVELKNDDLKLTISIGISKYAEDSIIAEDLVDIADKKMYKAKELGGNQVYTMECD